MSWKLAISWRTNSPGLRSSRSRTPSSSGRRWRRRWRTIIGLLGLSYFFGFMIYFTGIWTKFLWSRVHFYIVSSLWKFDIISWTLCMFSSVLRIWWWTCEISGIKFFMLQVPDCNFFNCLNSDLHYFLYPGVLYFWVEKRHLHLDPIFESRSTMSRDDEILFLKMWNSHYFNCLI